MLRNPYIVTVINILYILTGAVFFTLITGLALEHRGWFKETSHARIAAWLASVALMNYGSLFISEELRSFVLLFYLITSMFLVQYPLIRQRPSQTAETEQTQAGKRD